MTHAIPSRTLPRPAALPYLVAAPRPRVPTRTRSHRERDFGVGYGDSSGYASYRRYSSNWIQPRFRFG